MRSILAPFVHFQVLFLPGLIFLLAWAIWRTVVRKDRAVGLVLYLGLVIIVDGFLNTGIYLPGLERGSIRYSEICAAFLLVNRPIANKEKSSQHVVCLLVGVYFIALFLSVLNTDPMIEGFFEFRRIMVPQIISFLIGARGLSSADESRRFFLCLTTLVIIIGLFCFWDVFFDRWLLKSDMLEHPVYSHNRELGRFGSFFLDPNYLGCFVVLVFPAVLIWSLGEQRRLHRIYGGIGLLSLAFCLAETMSRGPLLAFGIALLILTLAPASGISRKRRLGFMLLLLIVFAFIMPGFYERSTERFYSLDREINTDSRSRHTLWLCSTRVIADHPLAGIGFGEQQYIKVMKSYGYDALDNPHNSYLQIAVYAGIPALMIFLFFNGILLCRAPRLHKRWVAEEAMPIVFGLRVGIGGFLLSIFPEPSLFNQTVGPVYWVFFGMLYYLVGERTGMRL